MSACAGGRERAVAVAVIDEPDPRAVILLDSSDPFACRFDMEQAGVQMTADDFDAWMRRHGLKIAGGGPASAEPGPPAAGPGRD